MDSTMRNVVNNDANRAVVGYFGVRNSELTYSTIYTSIHNIIIVPSSGNLSALTLRPQSTPKLYDLVLWKD